MTSTVSLKPASICVLKKSERPRPANVHVDLTTGPRKPYSPPDSRCQLASRHLTAIVVVKKMKMLGMFNLMISALKDMILAMQSARGQKRYDVPYFGYVQTRQWLDLIAAALTTLLRLRYAILSSQIITSPCLKGLVIGQPYSHAYGMCGPRSGLPASI